MKNTMRMVTSVLHHSLGPRLSPNTLSLTPYDVHHAAWKEEQEKQGRTVPRPGQFENRSPLTDWDKGRKKREIAVKQKIRKLKAKNYRTKAKKAIYKRMKFHVLGEGAYRMLEAIIYKFPDLDRLPKSVGVIHYTGTISQANFYLVSALKAVGELPLFTIAPWAYKRLEALKWFQHSSAALKKNIRVYCHKAKKFWTEKMDAFVEALVRIKKPFNEISAQLYHLYHHKIKTFSLIKMAIREGWVPPPRARPRRPPQNY
ncbi:hypothetical protein ES703_19522 [subsurface metagenome]